MAEIQLSMLKNLTEGGSGGAGGMEENSFTGYGNFLDQFPLTTFVEGDNMVKEEEEDKESLPKVTEIENVDVCSIFLQNINVNGAWLEKNNVKGVKFVTVPAEDWKNKCVGCIVKYYDKNIVISLEHILKDFSETCLKTSKNNVLKIMKPKIMNFTNVTSLPEGEAESITSEMNWKVENNNGSMISFTDYTVPSEMRTKA